MNDDLGNQMRDHQEVPERHTFLVLARDYRAYVRWCEKQNLNPKDSSQVIHVLDGHHMRGYEAKSITIVLLDDWTARLSHTGRYSLVEEIRMYEDMGTKVVRDTDR